MHLYSEKYFQYSQLFNKHAGLGLSLEKAEELLGNFTRMLGQYNFSKNQQYLDTMNFLRIEISNLYSLNSSRQIEIIKNLIDLQLIIFAQNNNAIELSTEELLQNTRKIFSELPETAAQKKWELVLDYLYFEYYFSKNELKLATQYYEKVNAELNTFLLYNNICLTSRFLVSKIKFCDEAGKPNDLDLAKPGEIVFDSMDTHAKVMVGIYMSMTNYRHKKIKEAINILNEIINTVSFKDFFHESIDVKMTLAYFYMVLKDYDLGEITLKSISRKIKTETPDKYNQVLSLIKVFDNEMTNADSAKTIAKNKDLFTLFLANNTKSNEVLIHLIPELKRKYQS